MLQVTQELQREREHSSYLVEELKDALNSPRPLATPGPTSVPKGLAPGLARRLCSVAGAAQRGLCVKGRLYHL